MKLKYIILLWIIGVSLSSCYKDLGNYDYNDINEITVKNIEPRYLKDIDDSLKIYPKLEGTFYSDTTKFSYEWEINRIVVAKTCNLELLINLTPGHKSCRYIITDRVTNHKKYHRFDLNVSSSTAGDLIVVLSKYDGRAELSYYRLDKPSNFAINYFLGRFGGRLGTNPQQLHIRYCESPEGLGFSNEYGRVMVLADDQINLIDKMEMRPDTIYRRLNEQSYMANVSYPRPEIKNYKSQYIIEEGIETWRKNAYGSGSQHNTFFQEISNGKLFYATSTNKINIWTPQYQYDQGSPYSEGPLSPYAFYDQMDPTLHDKNKQAGYTLGNLIVFDYRAGRFAYANSGVSREILEKRMELMPDYQLVYGSSTGKPDNTFFCILNKGTTNKLLLMKRTKEESKERDKDNVYSIIAQSTCDNTIINETTRYYVTKYSPYMFITHGNKLYRYNLDDIGRVLPGDNYMVANLTDYGYDSDAKITSLFVSRTESTILLGVSRYGSDKEALGEEPKGDILSFSYNSSNLQLTHNPKYTFKGISGIPVDIKVKYQTHWRDGKDFFDLLVDNI